ncbi:MAG: sulfatase-like hydrolase/transferase, partial [Armatimonadota bacterium]|nr:sulfatase-like hydrolase/transferase [Armatimonadota bacterium]
DMARQFLRDRAQDPDRPWLLWVGFCGPHGPFDPPRRYAEMYDPDEMPFPETYTMEMSDRPEFMRRPAQEATPEARRLVQTRIAYYYAMMTLIDGNYSPCGVRGVVVGGYRRYRGRERR